MSEPTQPFDRLKYYREKSLAGGGSDKLSAQHKKGKMSARERLIALLDKESLIELVKKMRVYSYQLGKGH